MKANQTEKDLKNEIAELKAKYPDNNWKTLTKQILQYAYDNNITNLEDVYKVLMFNGYPTLKLCEMEVIKNWKKTFGTELTKEIMESKQFQMTVESLHKMACARRRKGA